MQFTLPIMFNGGGRSGPFLPREEAHVFLLAGQSNMVGRASHDGGASYPPGALQWDQDSGALVAASDPLLHHDAHAGDMGLSTQFAIDYAAAHPGVTLIFVPAAHGGTSLSSGRWQPGGDLYAAAVARADATITAAAARVGSNGRTLAPRLSGIFWHQGESDIGNPSYADQLASMIVNMRIDIAAAHPATPFVLGTIGTDEAGHEAVNAAILDMPNRVAHVALADGRSGLSVFDTWHYDAPSVRLLGTRYAAALAEAALDVATVPGAPTSLAVTPGDMAADLSWTPPADTGGTPISDYVLEYSTDGGSSWTVFADGTSAVSSATIPGLTNDVEHTFRVGAVNGVGTGATSAAVAATPTASSNGPAIDIEAGAEAHWVFGADNPAFIDSVSGRTLSANGNAPTNGTGFVSVATGGAHGLLSDIADSAAVTMLCVVRVGASERAIVGGTLTGQNASDSWGMYTYDGNVYGRDRSGAFSGTNAGSAPAGQWFVAAMALDGTANVIYAHTAAAETIKTSTKAFTPSTSVLALGDAYYNGASSITGAVDCAEMIVWNHALTAAELADVAGRSVTRLAARGITLTLAG